MLVCRRAYEVVKPRLLEDIHLEFGLFEHFRRRNVFPLPSTDYRKTRDAAAVAQVQHLTVALTAIDAGESLRSWDDDYVERFIENMTESSYSGCGVLDDDPFEDTPSRWDGYAWEHTIGTDLIDVLFDELRRYPNLRSFTLDEHSCVEQPRRLQELRFHLPGSIREIFFRRPVTGLLIKTGGLP
ncbi:hypothetical protein JCM10450v2_001955 [Rhodotorula kratochvilovae]